jgi:hypothetical protein
MIRDHEANLSLIWDCLDKTPMNPDQWQNVCEAMAEIREDLGLIDEVSLESANWPFPPALI